MPNLFVIANDILFARFDEQGKDYDETLEKVFSYVLAFPSLAR